MIRGKAVLINLFFCLVFSALAFPCLAAESGNVAILLSGDEEAYAIPADAFKAEVNFNTKTFILYDDFGKNLRLRKKLFADKPRLILALGAKAAYFAKIWTKDRQDVPVIFAMVLNWQRYKLLDGQKNITGIAADIAPGTQFINLKTFMPKAKRIGVIYSPGSSHIVDRARQVASLLGLELVTEEIKHSRDFPLAYKKIRKKIDGYWVLKDPVIYGLNNIDWLARKCVKDQLVCLGQSKNIAELGMVFAVNPDINNIGNQAASMARNILFGNQHPGDIGVVAPVGTDIHINMKTAKRIGLKVSPEALEMATMVF